MRNPNRSGLIAVCLAISGACSFDPSPNDAGPDAMTMLPSDAGVRDDAGPPDAEPPAEDAGTPDVPSPDAGEPIDGGIVLAECGNGFVEEPEACDDGNDEDDDGCNESCGIENDWICLRRAPSRCYLSSEVIYVDGNRPGCPSTFADGSELAPFCRIQEGADSDEANVVVIRPGIYPEALRLAENVELVADGPVTVSGFTDLALEVRNGGAVIAYGLQFESSVSDVVFVHENASNATLAECEIGPSGGVGLRLASDALLTLDRTHIHDNDEGGLLLDSNGGYQIRNVVISRNGAPDAALGGVRIRRFSAVSTFVNNTVAENLTSNGSGLAGGIDCELSGTSIQNSIVWNNERNSGPSAISSECFAEHSIIGPDGNATGTNINQDPLFAGDDLFHILPESPGRNTANATVAPALDFDGAARPEGPGVDIGADEIP